MQQLTIEHKKIEKSNNNQKQIVSNAEQAENIRERKGSELALSRNVYRLEQTDTFFVESESTDNVYYFVRYNPSVFEWCSCPDNSMRGQKCKHQFAIEYAIRNGTLRDINKLPENSQRYPQVITAKSYEEDEYDF